MNYLTKIREWWKSLFVVSGEELEQTPSKEQSEESVGVKRVMDPKKVIVMKPLVNNNNMEQSLEKSTEVHSKEQPIVASAEVYKIEQSYENFLYEGQYDQYFTTPPVQIPKVLVYEELWDTISEKLPDGYSIPNPTSSYLYKKRNR